MVVRGFYPGRFQPFHKGHLHAVKHILEEVDEVVIGVTAAQFNFLLDNPFTAGERITMIRLALGELYQRCFIVPIDNVPNNFEWVCHVVNLTPRFEIVYTNNLLVRILFEHHGYEVRPIPWLDPHQYSGRVIRKIMIEGGNWREVVPEPVAAYLEEIKAEERLKNLAKTEKIPLPLK